MGHQTSRLVPSCTPSTEEAKAAITDQIFRQTDASKKAFIKRLNFLAANSDDSDKGNDRIPPELLFIKKELQEGLNATCELIPLEVQKAQEDTKCDAPPVLFGQLEKLPSKKTLLIYCHLNLHSTKSASDFRTEQKKPTRKEGKVSDPEDLDTIGPAMAWISAIEVFQKKRIEIPLNVKFCVDAMQPSHFSKLRDILYQQKSFWLSDIDFTAFVEDASSFSDVPSIIHGLRGVCKYRVEISAFKQSLTSEAYSGAVYEPMSDMCWLLNHLTRKDGVLNSSDFKNLVSPLSAVEAQLYESAQLNFDKFCEMTGADRLIHTSKNELIMGTWRSPSITIHGIEGASDDLKMTFVIPGKVVSKFSVQLVPNMTPDEVNKIFSGYLNNLWARRKSPNKFKVICERGIKPWLSDTSNSHYEAAARAIHQVLDVEANFICDGRVIPVISTLQEITNSSILLLQLGDSSEQADDHNEKSKILKYLRTIKVLASYIIELGCI